MPEETKRPLKVFLCHASADKPKVRELYRTLKRRGVQPWLDAEDLIPGQNWEVEIPKALLSSDAIIICLTPNSVDKEGYVQKEIKFALDKAMEIPEGRIFIIPARLEDCELPFSLRQYQAVNLYEKEGYTKLMKALKLRASQLERATVELPKAGETTAEIKNVVEEKEHLQPKEEKSEKPRPRKTKFQRKPNTAIIVALIGLAGTIVAALLSSPTIERWFSPAPSATERTMVTTTSTSRPPTSLQTIEPSRTPTRSFTSTVTPLPTEITDAKAVTMVLVPEGEFTMGRDGHNVLEEPAHRVYLDAYYVDKYEVTNMFYQVCVDMGGCEAPDNIARYNDFKYANHPVVNVNWYQAKAYCEWRGADLPTEAQWEKAARGTDGRTYPWGESIDCNRANHFYYLNFTNRNVCIGDTTEVGSYESGQSPYGAYDMAGNVWEWIDDWFDVYAGGEPDSSQDFGQTYRVKRGGAWHNAFDAVRSSYRWREEPTSADDSLGFRCSRSP